MYDEPSWLKQWREHSFSLNSMNPALAQLKQNTERMNATLAMRDTPLMKLFAEHKLLAKQLNPIPRTTVDTLRDAMAMRSNVGIIEQISAASYLTEMNLKFRDQLTPTATSVLFAHENMFRKEISVVAKIHEQFTKQNNLARPTWFDDLRWEQDSLSEIQKIHINSLSEVVDISSESVDTIEYEQLYERIDELYDSHEELQNSFDALVSILIEKEEITESDVQIDANSLDVEKVESPLLNLAKHFQIILNTDKETWSLQAVYNVLYLISYLLSIGMSSTISKWLEK